MKLSDRALERLRRAVALPDLTGTRYRLLHEIGRGGMGAVYLAEDTELGRRVALKILHFDDASPEFAARLRTEARTLAQLEHPNIVPLYDFGELPGGRLYYTMKYVQGQALREAAATRTFPERLRLFAAICEAAGFAHARGLVHRDLKPGNIMVGSFGEVQVMDWGLAQPAGTAGRTGGTPGFMAPEQQNRDTNLSPSADVFSLGRILEQLTDAPARPIRSIIAKAAAANPQDRYTDGASLAADVLRYLDGLPVTAHRETPFELLARWYNNNRVLLLLIAAYTLTRFLVFFWTRR